MCSAYHNAWHEGCNACIRHSGGAAPPAMTFSDSDWTREPAHARRAQAQRRTAMLASLTALGCVALAVGWFGVEQMLDANKTSAVAPAAASTPIVTTPTIPTPASPADAAASAVPDAAALATLEAEMRQRARDAVQQAAIDAARRKERAWERWYQRPGFCNENPTSAQMVECANHHIRARKLFEERYAAGRL
jgi:hypothetical protein